MTPRRTKRLSETDLELQREILQFWYGIADERGLNRSTIVISNTAVHNVRRICETYPELNLPTLLRAAAERTRTSGTSGHHVLNSEALLGELAQRERLNIEAKERMQERVQEGLRNSLILWIRAWLRKRQPRGLPIDRKVARACIHDENLDAGMTPEELNRVLEGEIP